MVGNDVDDRADSNRSRLGDQLLRFPKRAEGQIDRAVVRNVVAGVRQRRRIPGVEPQRVHAKCGQVRQVLSHAAEIADAVAIGVGEAADVHLVDDGVAPPGPVIRTLMLDYRRRRRHVRSGVCRFHLPHGRAI